MIATRAPAQLHPALQPRAEIARQPVELGIGERAVHVGEGRQRGELATLCARISRMLPNLSGSISAGTPGE
jgi:hypothetical protein